MCLVDDPVEIEKLHGVRPRGNQPRRKEFDPMKAKVNVAGHYLRTIQREIQSHSYTQTAEIQVKVLHDKYITHYVILISQNRVNTPLITLFPVTILLLHSNTICTYYAVWSLSPGFLGARIINGYCYLMYKS